MAVKNKVAVLVAEFIGTFALTTVVLSMLTNGGDLFQTAAAAGFTLALMVLVIGPVSGAHINPAVTLGLWSIRKVETAQAFAYWGAQFLGAIAAWLLVESARDSELTAIAGRGYDVNVMFAELVGTMVFVFGIAAAVNRKYVGGQLAAAVGGSLTVGILIAAALGSNAVLNPAVALGIQSWSWTYALAPLAGAVIGANIYRGWFAKD